MKGRLFIFIGGSDEQNGDYSRVLRLARRGGTARWGSRLKTARPGDQVLIYIRQPQSALVARAEVLNDPERGEPGDYAYRTRIGQFEVLPNQVTIDDLRREFSTWDWLRYPRGAVAVPSSIAGRLWKNIYGKRSRVQILISNAHYGYKHIQGLATSGKTALWSSPKLTVAGDTVLFYVEKPISSVVAVGKALSGTRPTNRKWYRVKVGDIRLLDTPITLGELRKMFPGWAWLRSVNMFAYVSPERAKALLARVNEQGLVKPSNEQKAKGAGFGVWESNGAVERAAVAKVLRYYRKLGYSVVSREKDRVGYDLAVRNGKRELHVEVKGISGTELQFPITRNEVNRAEKDPSFRLVAVTEPQTPQSRLHPFTGRDLLRRFSLTPLAFMARRR